MKKTKKEKKKIKLCPECGADMDDEIICPECGYNETLQKPADEELGEDFGTEEWTDEERELEGEEEEE